MTSDIPYGLSEKDKYGFTHSIDKLVIEYELKDKYDFECFCRKFSQKSGFVFLSDREVEGYNSYFNKRPSSFYSWFTSSFWFESCNVKYGLYVASRILKGVWDIRRVIRLEFNPNKVYENNLFKDLQCLLQFYCKTGVLLELDYAVDVPFKTSDVICQSRANKVIYGDSRYYGQRHKNGRIKIYNKTKEMKDKYKIAFDAQITRNEVTFRCNEAPVFDSLWLSSGISSHIALSPNLRSVCDLLSLLGSYGEDVQELLYRYVPDKRNRDKLIPVLFGDKVTYIFSCEIFYRLLVFYAKLFNFWFVFTGDYGMVYDCPFGENHA